MDSKNLEDIFLNARGRKYVDFPSKKIAHYGIGGPIDLLIYPKDKDDCLTIVNLCIQEKIPYFLFGKGSNLLISDEGYRGVFIALDDCASELSLTSDISTVGAGIVLWDLVQATIKAGVGDMSNMSWIPGTVGGALFMNAGAFGTEIEEFVVSVDVITKKGEFKTLSHEECGFAYRKTKALQDKIILAAKFNFAAHDVEPMKLNSQYIIDRRKSKQPLDFPSCGSVFKRPPGNYAGTLIEQCGLKGYPFGGAAVSDKHANFILNKNDAKASDIYNIIKHIQKTVFAETGVTLEREVKLIGFKDVAI